MKKNVLGFIISLALALCIGAGACAETAQPLYQLGDKVEDFSLTLSDGTEVSLYALLAEKKAVVLNFWATYCGPCKQEFPCLQEVYQAMSDDIALIALSSNDPDTDEIILKYRQDNSLEGLQMGRGVELYKRFFDSGAVPGTVIIDRNGVVCFSEINAIPDTDKLTRLFTAFTGDDYAEPRLLTEVPAIKYTAAQPTDDEIRSALGLSGDAITWIPSNDAFAWPFIASKSGDSLIASNATTKDTTAEITFDVTVQEGEGLLYDCQTSLGSFYNTLFVDVDGETVTLFKDATDWKTNGLSFDAPGTHRVTFSCTQSAYTNGDIHAAIRNLKIGSAEELAAVAQQEKAAGPARLKTGKGVIEIAEGDCAKVVFGDPSQPDTTPAYGYIVNSDTMTLRIRIGQDVQSNLAYVSDIFTETLLSSLPQDETGYLYHYDKAAPTNVPIPYRMVTAYADVLTDTPEEIGMIIFCDSEAAMDEFQALMNSMLGQESIDMQMSWWYADGSERKTQAVNTTAATGTVLGTPEYVIMVADAEGCAVPGAMIQICDDATCRVETTDAEGAVKLELTPYPYEIHVLMAPAGYTKPDTLYAMPKEGGTLVITLEKE